MVIITEKDKASLIVPLPYWKFMEGARSPENVYTRVDNFIAWKIKNRKNTILAGWGPTRANDVLRYKVGLFKGEIDFETLSSYTLPKIREILDEEIGKPLDKDPWDNTYYVLSGNRAWEICNDFITEVEGVEACGRYSDLAISSFTKNKELPLDERIRIFCKEAEMFTGIKMFPVAVMDTKTENIRLIKK